MSALNQKQTFALRNVMSAFPPKADIRVRPKGERISHAFEGWGTKREHYHGIKTSKRFGRGMVPYTSGR